MGSKAEEAGVTNYGASSYGVGGVVQPPSSGPGYPEQGPVSATTGGSYQNEQPPPVGFVAPGTSGDDIQPPAYVDTVKPQTTSAPPAGGYQAVGSGDPEKAGVHGYTNMTLIKDLDLALKNAFIGKVFALLGFELLLTFGVVSVCTFVPSVKNWVNGGIYTDDYYNGNSDSNMWWIMMLIAFCIFLTVYIVIICSTTARRKVPYNYIFVMVLSLSMGYLLGVLSSLMDTLIVAMAMIGLVGICFLMIFFGFQKNIPIGGIFILTMSIGYALFCFALFCMLTWWRFASYGYMNCVYSALCVVFFSLVLLIDTWLIVNSGQHEVLMEEYVFCSLMLYIDIIYIFIYLLMLLGGSARN